MNNPKKIVCLLICASLGVVLLTPFLGLSLISPWAVWTPGSPEAEVFWRLRLPRAVAAFLAGAGLGVSGMIFQALFRNPLATPFTLGVSSGASLGASVYFLCGISGGLLGASGGLASAFLGAMLSMGLVFGLTRAGGGFSTPIMLLAGVIINFFFSSLVMFIQYLSDANDSLRIMHWLMGSLTGLETPRLADLAFVVVAGALLARRWAPEIDLLVAGEDIAASRGVAVKNAKIRLFAVASLIVAAIVSLTGPIGFVGMMAPHICRIWLGWSHRWLAPASFFLGGAFLCLCDVIARVALAPAELPIGIVTALIGGPFFLWTLFRLRRGGDFF